MTKICLWSDLHLEFQDDYPRWKNPGAENLVLSGDIFLAEHLYRNPTAGLQDIIQNGYYAKDAIRYRKFLDHVSSEFTNVFAVMGNHEHYNGRWERTEDIIRNEFSRYNNVHLLEMDKVQVGEVTFMGASLWTNFANGNPVVMSGVKNMMNDYSSITQQSGGNYHKLSPSTTLTKHHKTIDWLKKELSEIKTPVVFVGHHTPSYKSIHPRYYGQEIMNHAFCSDLSELILDNPQIKLWTAGHVHHAHRYYIGDTLIAVNPHGYPGETTGFDSTRIIDLDSMPLPTVVDEDYYWRNR